MAQPPILQTQSRQLVRSVPFVTPNTFVEVVLASPGDAAAAEFDTLEGFADVNLYNSVGAYPNGAAPATPVLHAVGPWLDAAVYATGLTVLRVEYAIDRGCAYHQATPDTAILATTFANISGLRITGRFVRVSLINNALAGAVTIEFGVYVRSA